MKQKVLYILITFFLVLATGCNKQSDKELIVGEYERTEPESDRVESWEFTKEGTINRKTKFMYSMLEDKSKKLVLEDGEDDNSGEQWIVREKDGEYELIGDIVGSQPEKARLVLKYVSGEDGLLVGEPFEGVYETLGEDKAKLYFYSDTTMSYDVEMYSYELNKKEITLVGKEVRAKYPYLLSHDGKRLSIVMDGGVTYKYNKK